MCSLAAGAALVHELRPVDRGTVTTPSGQTHRHIILPTCLSVNVPQPSLPSRRFGTSGRFMSASSAVVAQLRHSIAAFSRSVKAAA